MPMKDTTPYELWAEYIEWLVDPNREGTKKQWALDHGYKGGGVLTDWQNDSRFKRRLEQRLAELNIEPDRIQAVVDAMWTKAKAGDVQAAKLYLDYVKMLRPPKPAEHADVAQLSDEELRQALAQAAAGMADG